MQPAGPLALGVPTENLFITSQENYKKYDVFPEAAIKALPIYKTAERFERLILLNLFAQNEALQPE